MENEHVPYFVDTWPRLFVLLASILVSVLIIIAISIVK